MKDVLTIEDVAELAKWKTALEHIKVDGPYASIHTSPQQKDALLKLLSQVNFVPVFSPVVDSGTWSRQ